MKAKMSETSSRRSGYTAEENSSMKKHMKYQHDGPVKWHYMAKMTATARNAVMAKHQAI